MNITSISREEAKTLVGPGWASILDEIYDKLPKTTNVTQVKEKYGGLRFYVDTAPGGVLEFIMKKENESEWICEECGKDGKVRDTGGWYKALCDDHYDQFLAKDKR